MSLYMRVDLETLEVMLNTSDKYGNKISFNSTTGEVALFVKEANRAFNIGKITVSADHLIKLTKLENIDQFQRNLFAWSINGLLAELCDEFTYIAGQFEFTLDKISMLQHKIEKPWGGQGLDSKIYVPLKNWEVTSQDAKVQKRVDLLGIEWYILLEQEMHQEYFSNLSKRVNAARNRAAIYPDREDVFKAFKLTQPTDTKVVIIGQDPYHDGSGSGVAFGIKPGSLKIPPSLQNIQKELESDVGEGLVVDMDPSLLSWAEQGVFLINTKLTVEAGQPNSHAGWGWERFIACAIQKLVEGKYGGKRPIVFILWGKNAQEFEHLIPREDHFVIKSPHPSPFSADKGFFGSKPFSRANEYLKASKQQEISWI
jgi:uracil-DNA glycosylase